MDPRGFQFVGGCWHTRPSIHTNTRGGRCVEGSTRALTSARFDALPCLRPSPHDSGRSIECADRGSKERFVVDAMERRRILFRRIHLRCIRVQGRKRTRFLSLSFRRSSVGVVDDVGLLPLESPRFDARSPRIGHRRFLGQRERMRVNHDISPVPSMVSLSDPPPNPRGLTWACRGRIPLIPKDATWTHGWSTSTNRRLPPPASGVESRNGAIDLHPLGRERSETCGAEALVKQR